MAQPNRKAILICLILLLTKTAYGQSQPDTVQKLQEVIVKAYLSEQPILRLPSSVTVLDNRQLKNHSGTSLLPALNTVPGLRMEERSPGSYRLSIRGSLLRSPFGIRNIKIYIDDFPLTDAGGNTYLNAIDAESVNSLEVLKGPDGSLFGANSGGVVLINSSRKADTSAASIGLTGASFNSVHQQANLQRLTGNHYLQLNQAYQQSGGYRQNSSMNRHYGQVRYRWKYSPGSEIRFLTFYSDLDYQTPGGLTSSQYESNPRSARPATPVSPGAVEQHAGVFNKTLFGGVLNETGIARQLRHTFAVFGSLTDFRNPFITNFETRDEKTAGIRSYLEWTGKGDGDFTWKANTGLEWQQTQTAIQNYDNNGGQRGLIQSSNDITAGQYFYFLRFAARFHDRLNVELAASVNNYRYTFDSNDPGLSAAARIFDPQIMPRLAFSYQFSENLAWRSSISKGYSPPTVAEIRSSDQQINTSLQPESGWNFETGIRLSNPNNRFWLDASLFYYKLQKAIVRRVNANDSEFFLNAGGTKQIGFESQISAWLIPPSKHGMLKGLQFRNSLTVNNFRFSNYQSGTADYSGNRLTGVPDQVIVTSADFTLPAALAFFVQHNYTSNIPLNDANDANAQSYHLVQSKLKWRKLISSQSSLELFAGVDNLLNAKYSLGNDLNAFGKRYYNAAPLRNFFGGLKVTF